MITRTYETERDCARLWINESMNQIDEDFILKQSDFLDRWEFAAIDDETDELAPAPNPMWSTYFEFADRLDLDWAEEHAGEIARLGFTLIYEDGYLWGIGIDGAGFDFYDAFWIPLYRLRGFTWHEGAA